MAILIVAVFPSRLTRYTASASGFANGVTPLSLSEKRDVPLTFGS
jgi:hypothetical protein